MTSLLESLIAVIAPHRCIYCSKENNIVCDGCWLELSETASSLCFMCTKPTSDFAVCRQCCKQTVLQHVWVAGNYDSSLQVLIKRFKFEHTPAAAKPLAALMQVALPILPEDCTIVPVPTISRHIRQRGFDHTVLLAKHLSKITGRPTAQLLSRGSQLRQLGSSRAERSMRATQAFSATKPVAGHVLLIDDVVTTGATLRAAASVMQAAGAHTVWAVTAARQAAGKQK